MSRSVLRWTVLGLAGFALVMLVRLPSRWLAPLLPAAVQCASLTGTLWRGHCAQLRLPGATSEAPLILDSVGWKLHPMALLRARVDADVQLTHRGGSAQGRVNADRSGDLRVDDFTGTLPVDRSLLAVLPSGWSSEVSAKALGFALKDGVLESLRGDAQLLNLRDAQGTSYGSFEVKFGDVLQKPPISGELQDVSGPLGVKGTVRIDAAGAWQIDGRISPRPQTPPELAEQLPALGLPDASGAYPFSIAGLLE